MEFIANCTSLKVNNNPLVAKRQAPVGNQLNRCDVEKKVIKINWRAFFNKRRIVHFNGNHDVLY